MVSNEIAGSTILRHELNNKVDTVPSIRIQVRNLKQNSDIIIEGIYRHSRSSTEIMKSELNQFHHQIFSVVQAEKIVVLLGDLNLDHNNPEHI